MSCPHPRTVRVLGQSPDKPQLCSGCGIATALTANCPRSSPWSIPAPIQSVIWIATCQCPRTVHVRSLFVTAYAASPYPGIVPGVCSPAQESTPQTTHARRRDTARTFRRHSAVGWKFANESESRFWIHGRRVKMFSGVQSEVMKKSFTTKVHPQQLASGARRLVNCMALLCLSRLSENGQGASRRCSVCDSTEILSPKLFIIDQRRPRKPAAGRL